MCSTSSPVSSMGRGRRATLARFGMRDRMRSPKSQGLHLPVVVPVLGGDYRALGNGAHHVEGGLGRFLIGWHIHFRILRELIPLTKIQQARLAPTRDSALLGNVALSDIPAAVKNWGNNHSGGAVNNFVSQAGLVLGNRWEAFQSDGRHSNCFSLFRCSTFRNSPSI